MQWKCKENGKNNNKKLEQGLNNNNDFTIIIPNLNLLNNLNLLSLILPLDHNLRNLLQSDNTLQSNPPNLQDDQVLPPLDAHPHTAHPTDALAA